MIIRKKGKKKKKKECESDSRVIEARGYAGHKGTDGPDLAGGPTKVLWGQRSHPKKTKSPIIFVLSLFITLSH